MNASTVVKAVGVGLVIKGIRQWRKNIGNLEQFDTLKSNVEEAKAVKSANFEPPVPGEGAFEVASRNMRNAGRDKTLKEAQAEYIATYVNGFILPLATMACGIYLLRRVRSISMAEKAVVGSSPHGFHSDYNRTVLILTNPIGEKHVRKTNTQKPV